MVRAFIRAPVTPTLPERRAVGGGRAASLVLAIACACLFIGRALQHWFGEPPFRELLWNQVWLEPWVNRFLGMSWDAYVTSPRMDAGITRVIAAFGWLYAACACACLPWGRWRAWRTALLALGTAGLGLLCWLGALEKFLRLAEFLEPACQLAAPVLLILSRSRLPAGWAVPLARLAVAGTFIGHGAYAAGLYPVPGSFIDMVILHFGVREATAVKLLFAMGMLDFLVAATMLLPHRFAKPFLAYAAAWGAATALARTGYGFNTTLPGFGAVFFLPEVLTRLPHAAVPLWLLLRRRPDQAPKRSGKPIST